MLFFVISGIDFSAGRKQCYPGLMGQVAVRSDHETDEETPFCSQSQAKSGADMKQPAAPC